MTDVFKIRGYGGRKKALSSTEGALNPRIIVTVTIVSILNLWCSVAFAAGSDDKKYLLSEPTYKKLSAIHKLMDANRDSEAVTQLNALLPSVSVTPYEAAITYQTLGYAYNDLSNYSKAIDAFKNALRLDALPKDVANRINHDIAQLLIHAKRYDEGVRYLELWIKTQGSLDADGHQLAAAAYYHAQRFKAAVPHILALTRQRPDDNWYQMLLSCYFETAQYSKAGRLLEDLVARYPSKKNYWMQLISSYQQAGQDKRALATMELAYQHDLLTGKEILQLAQMYMYVQMPYKGAKLLESEFKTGRIGRTRSNQELLVNAWLLAQEKEKAAAVLKQLARSTGSPQFYFRQGQLLFDLERWNEATEAFESASNSKNAGNARLMQGLAFYYAGNTKQSLHSLDLASQYEQTRNQAQWWIKRIRDKNDSNSAEG